MGDSRLRSGKSGSSVAGLPADGTDEALIGLVQSLPYDSPRRAAAYGTWRRIQMTGSADPGVRISPLEVYPRWHGKPQDRAGRVSTHPAGVAAAGLVVPR
jgi:hypothetical protein